MVTLNERKLKIFFLFSKNGNQSFAKLQENKPFLRLQSLCLFSFPAATVSPTTVILQYDVTNADHLTFEPLKFIYSITFCMFKRCMHVRINLNESTKCRRKYYNIFYTIKYSNVCSLRSRLELYIQCTYISQITEKPFRISSEVPPRNRLYRSEFNPETNYE